MTTDQWGGLKRVLKRKKKKIVIGFNFEKHLELLYSNPL